MNLLITRALTILAGATIAFAGGWTVNGWRLNQKITAMERDQAAAVAAATETARLIERANSRRLEDARNEATKRETTIRRNADTARNAADGLRNDLAEIRRNLPNLTGEAVRQRADTLAELFGACTDEYRGLAEKADRHASDVQTLSAGWPE